MRIPYVDVSVKSDRELNEILQRMERVLRSGRYVLGQEVEEFEKGFASFCGVKYAIGVNSGTDALFLTLKALGIGRGDEVVTVGNSFIATVGAIAAAGAKPLLVDVDYDDMLMNTSLIEEHITDRTKAIIPVHLTGLPCDMDEINKIARKYKLYAIEDACQAVGATYKGQKVGSIGDVGCFSFHPLKNLATCGDGGMITINNEGLFTKTKHLRNHGLKDRDTVLQFGYNSRLDTIHACILGYQLKKIDEITKEKRENASLYSELLYPLKIKGEIDYFRGDEQRNGVHQLFIIKTKRRNELQSFLYKEGIETKIHYPIPIHKQHAFMSKYGSVELPITERLADEILSVPIWQGMNEKMIKRVCTMIHTFFASV